jgi:acetylornithine deacetylase/succinyl-diaminopimelate desuccinylase-like protein
LHSGYYGGAVPNPLHLAGQLIDSLHDDQGRVAIKGFYDGVKDIPVDLKQKWDSLCFDEAAFLGDIGLKTSVGEAGYSLLERIWSRPTAEVNGVIGGYTGMGTKTVIASEATVKLSFRLVPGQIAADILQNFQDHARALMPEGVSIAFSHLRGVEAVELDTQSPYFIKAGQALMDEYGKPAGFIGMGGSIPIVQDFKNTLGMESLMVGFACEDDNIHSPNEKYNISSYHKGTRSWARIIAALGAMK